METKMRLKLYDKDEKLLQDRLVEQKTEFSLGPKEKHDGPLVVEFNLRDKDDVNSAIAYLGKLALDLPISEKIKKSANPEKAINKMLSEKEPVLDLKRTVLAKAKTQEELVKLLREYNFRFMSWQQLDDLNMTNPDIIKLKQIHKDNNWQFMVRLIKEAKDPANDKWDCRLAFGIKFEGKRIDRVQIYLWGVFEERVELPWADKDQINFKKKEKIMVFPEFMSYEDRKKWRLEHRKLQQPGNEALEPSKNYAKYKPYIKVS